MDNKHNQDDLLNQVDPSFEPWEQSRPVPLLVLAVVMTLGLWGIFNYASDLLPQRKNELVHEGVLSSQAAAVVQDAIVMPVPVLVQHGNTSIWSCASCHGDGGMGNGQTPALAGLSKNYLLKQLKDFQSGRRSNESMVYVAKQLSNEEMVELASYYAALPNQPHDVTSLGASMERGQQLALFGDWKHDVPACVTCHGSMNEGVGDDFPRLAGQQAEYIFSQLVAWKGGSRNNSPQSLMDDISGRMSTDDMRAVAQYLGSVTITAKEVNHE